MHRARLFINSAASPHTVLAYSRLLDEMAATAAAAAGGACVGMPVAAAAGRRACSPCGVWRTITSGACAAIRRAASRHASCSARAPCGDASASGVSTRAPCGMRAPPTSTMRGAAAGCPAAGATVARAAYACARCAPSQLRHSVPLAPLAARAGWHTCASSTGTRGAAPLATSRGRAR